MKKKVIVFSTGGTILSSAANPTELTNYTNRGTKISDILSLNRDADVEYRELYSIPSSQVGLPHWKTMISETEKVLSKDDVAGAVITHGTDTLEESAFLMNLIVKSDKPIVFTGAMRPNGALGSDGELNLNNSIKAAMSPLSQNRGVLVCFNGKIGDARLITKTHTLDPSTFQAPEYGFCGFIINDYIEFLSRCDKPHTKSSEFELNDLNRLDSLSYVPVITSYPEETSDFIDAALMRGAKGIVYAGMGHGNVTPAAEKALSECRKRGVIVVRASRTGGPVLPSKEKWMQMGFIPSGSLSANKARLLLALSIAKYGQSQSEAERIFRTY